MSGLYLDLGDKRAVADFMESVIEFLPAGDRRVYQKSIDKIHESGDVPEDRLMEMAKNIGAVSWPARYALNRFLEDVGSELEWEKVLEALRPATRALLKELKKLTSAKTIDDALASADASIIIHPEQEIEIQMVREEVRMELWEEHNDNLEPLIQEGLTELEAIRKRLKQMRKQAEKMNGSPQDLILKKLDMFEDRLYFGGEMIPLDVLETELQYDAGDAADPIETR
jgi:hypothetical protein